MKRLSLAASIWLCTLGISAQPEDVTKKYLENPDFEARFAAWVNPGKFTSSKTTYIDYQCVSTGCCLHVAKIKISIDNQHVTKSMQR